MPATGFDERRAYDAEQFATSGVCHSDRLKAVCGYFEPGQFIPVHAPASDVVVHVHSGTGIVREGETDHCVAPGDVVAVAAGTDHGVRADGDTRLEALLVTAPPPGDEEHDPVRRGLRANEFEP